MLGSLGHRLNALLENTSPTKQICYLLQGRHGQTGICWQIPGQGVSCVLLFDLQQPLYRAAHEIMKQGTVRLCEIHYEITKQGTVRLREIQASVLLFS
jgi:hypothetical protein